jgi:hypothetical protein
MTIKMNWFTHIPIINKEIARSRILEPGDTIQVIRQTENIDDMHFPLDEFDEKITVQDPDTLSLVSREITHLYRKKAPDEYTLEGPEINRQYRDDRYLYSVRIKQGFSVKNEVKIEWEPTLPPQTRK